MDENGTWKLAPAYDLTFSNSSHGFHSRMIMGESQNPNKENLLKMANYFKVKKGKEIIEQVQGAISNWKQYAKQAGVEKESSALIQKRVK